MQVFKHRMTVVLLTQNNIAGYTAGLAYTLVCHQGKLQHAFCSMPGLIPGGILTASASDASLLSMVCLLRLCVVLFACSARHLE